MANPIVRRFHGPENPRSDLSASEANHIFSYDPKTGLLQFKGSTPWATSKAIFKTGRNRVVARLTVTYQAHRLIWLLMTGEWPKSQIDHINGDPSDNRWINLREASRSQNAVNRSYKTNSPYRGVRLVRWVKSNGTSGVYWRARISIDKRRIELGCFPSAEEAYEAYKRAAIKHHGPFARLI